MTSSPDAVVVGSGPNGLAAAITLAREGRSVVVHEANESPGGGVHSAELTLPGFVHDVCSSIYPFLGASPFLRSLPLEEHGVDAVHPPAPVAHPLDDGSAVVLERSVEATAAGLGDDAHAYRKLFAPLVASWEELEDSLLGPLVAVPRHPLALARFGLHALRSASGLARGVFAGERARALFGGCAAHSMLPLDRVPSASFGLVLMLTAHRFGWPFPRGGAERLTQALVAHLASLGGEVRLASRVDSLAELDEPPAVLCDVGPRELDRLAGERLPGRYRRALASFPYGPGAFKVDYALDGPVPWTAEECARAGTVHVCGSLADLEVSERAPWRREHAERPFVLLAQHTLFDPGRAPEGKHTVWAYCHVPNGSTLDMSERIERQIERFAPGFRERILARSVMGPSELEARNRNLVGGDLNGGAATLTRLLARPTLRPVPYATPAGGVYLCSASTPPGGGVHGMCGYLAAQAALARDLA